MTGKLRVTAKEKSALALIYKSVVAACQLGAQAIAFGLLHGTALHVTSLVIAALGLIGVYKVPNAPKEVVAGTAELEARMVGLETVVPNLPELVEAVGQAIESNLTKVLAAPLPASPVDYVSDPPRVQPRRRPSPHSPD